MGALTRDLVAPFFGHLARHLARKPDLVPA
jgi:hypothetical protein